MSGATPCPDDRRHLAESVYALCWREARRASAHPLLRRHSAADLASLAMEGAVKAAVRFDPARGCAFTTYAVHWMRAAFSAEKAMMSRAKRAGMLATASLDAIREHQDGGCWSLLEGLADGGEAGAADGLLAAEDEGERREEAAWAVGLLERMEREDPSWGRAVRLRVMEGMKLEAIGDAMGLTKERIRQLVAKGLERLREIAEGLA